MKPSGASQPAWPLLSCRLQRHREACRAGLSTPLTALHGGTWKRVRRRVSGATWVPAANVLERVLSMLKGWDREVPGEPMESQASKVKTGKEGEGEGNCQKHPLRRALKPRGGEWSERGGAGRGCGWWRAQLQDGTKRSLCRRGWGCCYGKGGVGLGLRTHKGVFSRWPSRPDAGRGPGAGTGGGAGRAAPPPPPRRLRGKSGSVRSGAARPGQTRGPARPLLEVRTPSPLPDARGFRVLRGSQAWWSPQMSSGLGGPEEAHGGGQGSAWGEGALGSGLSRSSAGPALLPPSRLRQGEPERSAPGGALDPPRPDVPRGPFPPPLSCPRQD